MDANFIAERLRALFFNHLYKLHNTYVFDWESDLFSVTKTGTIYETEIKISRSDFKADFEKPKHKLFANHKTGYFQERWPETTDEPHGGQVDWGTYRTTGRKVYSAFPYCRQKWHNSDEFFMPNKFYFACPWELLWPHEIPAYAGLIWIDEAGETKIVKPAPFMHKRPIIGMEKMHIILRDKFYYLSLKQHYEIRELKRSK